MDSVISVRKRLAVREKRKIHHTSCSQHVRHVSQGVSCYATDELPSCEGNSAPTPQAVLERYGTKSHDAETKNKKRMSTVQIVHGNDEHLWLAAPVLYLVPAVDRVGRSVNHRCLAAVRRGNRDPGACARRGSCRWNVLHFVSLWHPAQSAGMRHVHRCPYLLCTFCHFCSFCFTLMSAYSSPRNSTIDLWMDHRDVVGESDTVEPGLVIVKFESHHTFAGGHILGLGLFKLFFR